MRTDKLNSLGIFQNNIGKADLTRAENISRIGIYDFNTDPTVIIVGMVEGTSNGDPVGIVFAIPSPLSIKKPSVFPLKLQFTNTLFPPLLIHPYPLPVQCILVN